MKVLKIVAIALLLLIPAAYWFFAIPNHVEPNGEQSRTLFANGAYDVITDNFKAVDTSRPTDKNNGYPGSTERVLKGKLWRPANLKAPGPLLVYSHGFMSFHEEGIYLDRFLASHGYTVVAVDYPLTNFFAPGNPKIDDVVNQPGDVSFLIDTILKRAQDKNDVLYNTIDAKRIATAGVSLGGLTTSLVAYHLKVRDPRLAAAISIAGPSSMFEAEYYANNSLPFMMLAGTQDVMVPYNTNARDITEKNPGSILVTLQGGTHTGFAMPSATFMRFMGNPDNFGCKGLMRFLKVKQGENFLSDLNQPQYHVNFTVKELPCSGEIPPTAMSGARQHMFTTLAVYAFLQSVFAGDEQSRLQAREYLTKTLPAENPAEVKVATRQ